MEHPRPLRSSLKQLLNTAQTKTTNHPITDINHSTKQSTIKGKIVIVQNNGQSGPGKSASVCLYSRIKIDPNTGKGKLSERAYLKHGKSSKHDDTKTITYRLKFHVDPEFGIPGAFVIKSRHKHKFFLRCTTLQVPNHHIIHFECNSWVYPVRKTKTDRLFFSNTSYLPGQTPTALVELRKDELTNLRGDGTGERKEWDRIYDYDYYNDLGNPNKGRQYVRPVLGGSESHPYPRRGRTGRLPSNQDPLTESRPGIKENQPGIINLDIYVPPDEKFSPKKLSEFAANSAQAIIHYLISQAKSLFQQDSSSYESFDEIREMFISNKNQAMERWVMEKLKKLVPDELFKEITHAVKGKSIKFPLPQIIAENELAWKDDKEFGRQMLAGVNPTLIQSLETFPPQSKNGVKSSIKASDIEHNLDGLTLSQAMSERRIFILDHHDYLIPYLKIINTKNICAYATRTLLFLRNDATLKPLAIELSLTGASSNKEINRVVLPAAKGTEAALWHLAKTHVAVNDSAYHQLNSHWLKTHAVVEPFIIATRRQLSVMHPIHQLLDPHFKDTMHINALARSILINSGGILEKTMFTGKISMELSSVFYKDWRFDEQGLPADLLKRHMALEDPRNPAGIHLLFEDYPYAADGLEIWNAIRTWVTDFCSIFYENDGYVQNDEEIQAWWSEIRNVGHGDKRNEMWRYQMTTLSDLIEVLTILIWTTSAFHASVNFGQYVYGSYPPNRPTMCHKFIPEEGTLEFSEFLLDPDKYYLKMLPKRFETTLAVALAEVLSHHMSDEVFLGQRPSTEWTDNEMVQQKFKKFGENLREVEKRFLERNRNPRLKNRGGPAKIPYKLMYPGTSKTGEGITGKGIPNSISI